MTGTRVLTALVLVPAVVGIVLLTPTWVVALCVAAVTLVALREFFDISAKAGFRGYPIWTGFAAVLILLFQFAATGRVPAFVLDFLFSAGPGIQGVFLLFAVGLAANVVLHARAAGDALPGAAVSCAGLLLVALPLSYLVRLCVTVMHGNLVLLVLVMIWAGDSVAYFVGRALGRHKLAPTISPNKTWEGAIGNILGTVVAAQAYRQWLLSEIAIGDMLIVAVLASVAGQLGDLMESAWKRSAGVKDSGTLLPGHGGMLDRIDALILAAPVVWWYFRSLGGEFIWQTFGL